MRHQSRLLLGALLLVGCRSLATDVDARQRFVVADLLTGSFSSEAQAAVDPEHFFDIRLFTTPIWTDRADGPWLYVEQASASALDRPYRQRVYRLVDVPDGVRSDVFTLPGDALEFAGAWRDAARFDAISPEDLAERTGCSIHLVPIGAGFVGMTHGEGCESTLRGAAYATSKVQLSRDLLTSWDRGYDAEGTQAWGATEGPYQFVRLDG